MIPLFNRVGGQSIVGVENSNEIVSMFDIADLKNPATTYQDVQCGTGLVALVLAQKLMETLSDVIPNEHDRLAHIFGKQIHLSDIDSTQTRVARANILRAIGDRTFPVNVRRVDCFDNMLRTDYVFGSIEFKTTNDFVPFYQKLCKQIVIITRPNKNRYTTSSINQLYAYKFLGINLTSSTPMCVMHFKSKKKLDQVIFINQNQKITITNPKFLPGDQLTDYAYAEEVLNQKFEGYCANYGSFYSNADIIVNNPGKVPLIYNVGTDDTDKFSKVIKVSKKIITENEGVGKHKIVINKNGNRGHKSIIKYAGPEYGTGHNAIWIEVADQKEAEQFKKVWETPCFDKLICTIKETTPANGVEFWNMVPNIKHLEAIQNIYDKYYKS